MKGSVPYEASLAPGRSVGKGFFEGVPQVESAWRDRTVCSPTFYYDTLEIQAQFLAPLKAVTALLPSRRMHPLRVTPWHAPVVITAWVHRDTDIGPYNELAIGIPGSLSGSVRPFTGLLWPQPTELDFYLLHLPVTTEIACDLGIEMGAYPKFIASIDFSEDAGWITCRLSEGEQPILTLAVRKAALKTAPRQRIHVVNVRGGRLLRPLFIIGEHEGSSSKNASDVRLELTDHPVARELKQLPLGRAAACSYAPHEQGILTYVEESLAV